MGLRGTGMDVGEEHGRPGSTGQNAQEPEEEQGERQSHTLRVHKGPDAEPRQQSAEGSPELS